MNTAVRFGSDFYVYGDHQMKQPQLKEDLARYVVERLNQPQYRHPRGFQAAVESDGNTGQMKEYQNEHGDSVLIIHTPTLPDEPENIQAERETIDSLKAEMGRHPGFWNATPVQYLGEKVSLDIRPSEEYPDRTYLLTTENYFSPPRHWRPLHCRTDVFDKAHLAEVN